MATKRRAADYTFTNHGSLWLVRARTQAAYRHLAGAVGLEATWLGQALAVEPRYVDGLADGLQADGFTTGGAA